jgi:hypothetical protein
MIEHVFSLKPYSRSAHVLWTIEFQDHFSKVPKLYVRYFRLRWFNPKATLPRKEPATFLDGAAVAYLP